MRRTDKNFLLVDIRRYDMPTCGDCLWLKNLLQELRVWGGVDQYVPTIVTVRQSYQSERDMDEQAREISRY